MDTLSGLNSPFSSPDSASLVVGMVVATVIFMLGYIVGGEHAKLANSRVPLAKPVDDNDSLLPGDEWRKGTIYENGFDQEES